MKEPVVHADEALLLYRLLRAGDGEESTGTAP